ncbi:MAG: Na+ dependent nucleoside transporter [Flavobacteriales bacterium]|nr:Na+ dependent nucleoside transporter [Flavobacteriales bacterium]|tara:strand:+ start:221 stop:1684 length:1464 start_codon:yes stop_codon:yes gene_type:complete
MKNVIILLFIFYSFISFSYSLELDNLNVISLEDPITIKQDMGFQYEISSIESITKKNFFNINSIFRGFLGILSLLIIAFLFSRNKRNIDWKLVLKGLVIQLIFAVLILKVPIVSKSFEFVGKIFTKIISFTQDGTIFLFSSFDSGIIESPLVNFVVMILPTVIFFSAITSLFYYWRIIPKIVYGFAWFMKRTMGLSGPESVAAAGNIFLGQTESPLLVKPYLEKMTISEMLCLMSGGMATIAGGVLAAYIGYLGGDDVAQQIIFAKHLLAASVMSAPAAVVAAKILIPERENFETKLEVNNLHIGSNALEAISKGTTDGIKLAVNVGAMLLVFISLMSMANYILLKVGDWTAINSLIAENTHYNELSFNMILGYIGAPIAWLMGVCSEDMFLVGQLLGEKTVLNEFVAYVSLSEMQSSGAFLEKKSIIIATYILCGFANFASIGIQIGGIGALAPKRKSDLAKLGFFALLAGTLASLFTASIVGMLI